MFWGEMSIMLSVHAAFLLQLDIGLKTNAAQSKVKVPVAILYDNEIFKLCRASTKHECQTEINNISQNNEFAAQYKLKNDIT